MSKEVRMRRRAGLIGSVSLIAVSLAGCGANNPFKGPGGFIHPQIGPMNYSQSFTYDTSLPDAHITNDPNSQGLKSFDLALAKAEKLDMQLYNAMWWNDTYGFLTGLGMFGAGVATLAFGVFDASRTLLLGGGLATSTLAGVRTLYPFGERNDLYSSGRVAVQCAVEATQAAVDLSNTLASSAESIASAPGGQTFDEVLTRSMAAALALQRQLDFQAGSSGSKAVSEEVQRQLWMMRAGDDAAALLQAVEAGRAVQAEIQPDVQASTLNAIVMRIQALVDTRANKLRTNPEDALAIAREQLQKTLTGVKEAALSARDTARQIDNQRVRPPKESKGEGNGATPTGGTPDPTEKTEKDEAVVKAKVVADDAAARKDAAEVNLVQAQTDAEKTAAASEVKAATDQKVAADQDLAAATVAAREALEKQAKAEAASVTNPTDAAAFWANVLSARMSAIETKLGNIDSCTSVLQSGSS